MKSTYFIILLCGAATFGAVLGSVTVALFYAQQDPLLAVVRSPADFNVFTGILLACIALIITVLGVILAVLGVYGFSAIQEKVAVTAESAAKASVAASLLEGGELYELTRRTVREMAYRGAGLDESSGALDPTDDNGQEDE